MPAVLEAAHGVVSQLPERRTNGQSRPFEEAFRARGIRHEVVGGTEFFDRREVRDVLAYLKLLANPADEVSGPFPS